MSTDTGEGHGSSPAAWVAVLIMIIAFTVGTLAFWFDWPLVVIASAGLLVLGPIVGWLLARAGYGVGGDRVREKAHD